MKNKIKLNENVDSPGVKEESKDFLPFLSIRIKIPLCRKNFPVVLSNLFVFIVVLYVLSNDYSKSFA